MGQGSFKNAYAINVSRKKSKCFKNDLKWLKNDLSGERLKNIVYERIYTAITGI